VGKKRSFTLEPRDMDITIHPKQGRVLKLDTTALVQPINFLPSTGLVKIYGLAPVDLNKVALKVESVRDE
jgi:hypothetical protein